MGGGSAIVRVMTTPPVRYPWDEWMDGSMWRLTPADFPTTTRRHMMKMIYQYAYRHGMKVVAKRSPGGNIVMQRLGPDPDPSIFMRRGRPKTHCAAGHPYDEENTRVYVRPNGVTDRVCRECHRLNEAGRRTAGLVKPRPSTRTKNLTDA